MKDSLLLDMLIPGGTACLILQSTESIFADFTRSMSPDEWITLVGDELTNAFKRLDCDVAQHTYTKWLAINDLFESGRLSNAGLAFAAFVAMQAITTFTPEEREHIVELFKARREAQGVPLRWDVILVKQGSG